VFGAWCLGWWRPGLCRGFCGSAQTVLAVGWGFWRLVCSVLCCRLGTAWALSRALWPCSNSARRWLGVLAVGVLLSSRYGLGFVTGSVAVLKQCSPLVLVWFALDASGCVALEAAVQLRRPQNPCLPAACDVRCWVAVCLGGTVGIGERFPRLADVRARFLGLVFGESSQWQPRFDASGGRQTFMAAPIAAERGSQRSASLYRRQGCLLIASNKACRHDKACRGEPLWISGVDCFQSPRLHPVDHRLRVVSW